MEPETPPILVVDDDTDLRTITLALLRLAGIHALSAENGLVGLEILKSRDDIGCLVTDLKMPVMTGLELIEQLRSHPPLEHLPVIVMTAYQEKIPQSQLEALRVSTWLTKPFDHLELASLIKSILNPGEKAS